MLHAWRLHFHFELACGAGGAVVLTEPARCEDDRFVECLRLDFGRMTKALGVREGDDAGTNWQEEEDQEYSLEDH
jgi:hypothetical protein